MAPVLFASILNVPALISPPKQSVATISLWKSQTKGEERAKRGGYREKKNSKGTHRKTTLALHGVIKLFHFSEGSRTVKRF